MPGNIHSEGGGNHSSPQTWNQHILLPVRNISRLISPRHFYNISLLSRGMLSWEIARKSGSDGWRWRQSERQQGEKVWQLRRGSRRRPEGKDRHVRGRSRLCGKIKLQWTRGCRWRSGRSSAPPPPQSLLEGNNHRRTTLTWCGQQLSSCCFCLICSPPQYVWYACCKRLQL